MSSHPCHPPDAVLDTTESALPPAATRMLTWVASERDLAAVAATRVRLRPARTLPPCARVPQVCRALQAMSA